MLVEGERTAWVPEGTTLLASLTKAQIMALRWVRLLETTTKTAKFQVPDSMTLTRLTIASPNTMEVVLTSHTAAVFGKSSRGGLDMTSSPGPGAYDLGTGTGTKSGRAFIARKGRDDLRASDTPGPGAYDDQVAFDRLSSAKGGLRFGKSSNLARPDGIPGPGAYEQNGVADKRGGGVKFGREPREHDFGDDKPGPGAYNEYGGISPNPSKYTFSKAPRDKQQVDNTPFYYDLPPSIPDVAKYNYPDVAHRKIKP